MTLLRRRTYFVLVGIFRSSSSKILAVSRHDVPDSSEDSSLVRVVGYSR